MANRFCLFAKDLLECFEQELRISQLWFFDNSRGLDRSGLLAGFVLVRRLADDLRVLNQLMG